MERVFILVVKGIAALVPVVIGTMWAVPMDAQSAKSAPLAFEVASIKPDSLDSDYAGEHIHINRVNDHLLATGLTPRYLIQFAYGVERQRISAGPSWVDSAKYNIDAKIEDSMIARWQALSAHRREQQETDVERMFQTLLADRFQLKLSHQTTKIPVDVLIVSKKGPKIRAAKTGEPQGDDSHDEGDQIVYSQTDAPLDDFAKFLSRQRELNGVLVLNETGLPGRYDFSMRWTIGMADAAVPSPNSSGISLWAALREQLGLKLESRKRPVDILVIDHIEKPSDN